MDDTDFDLLCESVSPETAKRLRKVLAQWSSGDENSFPVQLALLTQAQWHAAARTPLLLRQSLELLDRKLGEYRQHTASLLRNFDTAANTKVEALVELLATQRDSAQQVLTDLRGHTVSAKVVLNQIQDEMQNSARELKKLRDDTEAERRRLEQARRDYESRQDWSDWIIFIVLLAAVLLIGVGIGSTFL